MTDFSENYLSSEEIEAILEKLKKELDGGTIRTDNKTLEELKGILGE